MPNTKPNVILLISDNHRVDQIGCAASPLCRTPNLDRIGAQGVVMENARTPSPVCSPARASLFTGFRPHQAGVPTVHLVWEEAFGNGHNQGVLARPLITEHLREAGYQCLYAGKWHVGDQVVQRGFDLTAATDSGFQDYMDWCREQGIPNGFLFRDPDRGRPFRYHEAPHMIQPYTAPLDIPAEKEHNRWMLDNAFELLRRRDPNRPLFMVFSTYGPHPPLSIPEPFYSMYDPRQFSRPDNWGPTAGEPSFLQNSYFRKIFRHWGEDFDRWRKAIAVSCGYASYIDSLFGSLLGELNTQGLLDNTLTVMVSDHGDMLGQHGLYRLFSPYEEALRVPWLMSWPGVIEPGRRCPLNVSLMDVAATILAAAGIETEPLGLEGQDVLPYVTGRLPEPETRDVFSQFDKPQSWHSWHGIEDWRCVVSHPWKLMLHKNGERELYNLEEDPGEKRNLSAGREQAPIVRVLESRLRDSFQRTGDSFPA